MLNVIKASAGFWMRRRPGLCPNLNSVFLFTAGQKAVLSDVHAELDRMTRKPVPVSPTTPTSPTEGEAS